MPIHRLPQSPQNWQISYGPDGTGDFVRSFNVSLTMMAGKITTSRRIQPHTTTSVSSLVLPPSQYVISNADGVLKYWKHWNDLWKTPTYDSSLPFVQDTLTNSPSDVDGDLAVFGRTEDGLYDILYATNVAGSVGNIAKFDRDFSTTAWVPDYWTGLMATVAGNSGSPIGVIAGGFGFIRIHTTAAHGYSTGDTVIIRDTSRPEANGTWTIAVVSATDFDLGSSGGLYVADGYGGTSNRIYAAATGFAYLGQPALDPDFPIILKRFSSAQQDLLFVGNGNVLHSIDQLHTVDFSGPDARTSNVVYRRLVFFEDYAVNWIQVTKDRVYAGFRNRNDPYRPSYVVEYDPLTETSNAVINNNGQTIGFIYENICHIIDVKGWISRFNSNGFTNVSAFPIAYIDGIRFTPPHRNGVAIIDGRPHVLMPSIAGGAFNQSFSQIFPAGVWCWEPDTNRLYHKGSIARSNSVQNDFGAANAGTAISRYGALFALPSTNDKSQDLFAGAQTSLAPQSINSIVGTFSTIVVTGATSFNNRGWVVTPKFYSKDINAVYRNIVAQYDNNQYPLGRQSGALVIKYRTSDPVDDGGIFRNGTWVTPTTFTVSAATTPNIAVGDEIFILFGIGGGLSAHVTALSGAGTRTVTIDESFAPASGLFAFFYENWRKLTDETYLDGQIDDNTVDYHQLDIPENEESFIQFKVEIRSAGVTPFRGFALEELGLGYQENLRQEGGQRDRSS